MGRERAISYSQGLDQIKDVFVVGRKLYCLSGNVVIL